MKGIEFAPPRAWTLKLPIVMWRGHRGFARFARRVGWHAAATLRPDVALAKLSLTVALLVSVKRIVVRFPGGECFLRGAAVRNLSGLTVSPERTRFACGEGGGGGRGGDGGDGGGGGGASGEKKTEAEP